MRKNSWNGNGMKVVENLWNGMIGNCYGMEWKWNSNFQGFGSLVDIDNEYQISFL
jgi:hypothetical protein